MNLDALSIFLTVAEEMNFTRAAHKLHMTQQSLSGHIKRLEKEYKVNLFSRKPALKLTAEGEAFVFYAGQMLRTQRSLLDSFADISRDSIGYLDLGISHQRSGIFFEEIWNRFHPDYPNIDVRLHEENTAVLLNLLRQSEISLMIGIDIPASPGYHTEQLSHERMLCIVRRSLIEKYYPQEASALIDKCRKNGLQPAALSLLPLIVLPEGNRFRGTMDRMFRMTGVKPRIILESGRQDLALNLSLRGEGMAFLSPIVLYDYYKKNSFLPEDCYCFEVPHADDNIIVLASALDECEPRFVTAMKRAIRETYQDYNKTMKLTRSK